MSSYVPVLIVYLQLASVLTNDYSSVIENCIIVDCRYPYEYDGGHIKVISGSVCSEFA